MRASLPFPNATPLLIISDGSPSGPSISGFCVQAVRPDSGSMASVRPKPFGTYSTPSTMIGVTM
jgi:hypothetical protein